MLVLPPEAWKVRPAGLRTYFQQKHWGGPVVTRTGSLREQECVHTLALRRPKSSGAGFVSAKTLHGNGAPLSAQASTTRVLLREVARVPGGEQLAHVPMPAALGHHLDVCANCGGIDVITAAGHPEGRVLVVRAVLHQRQEDLEQAAAKVLHVRARGIRPLGCVRCQGPVQHLQSLRQLVYVELRLRDERRGGDVRKRVVNPDALVSVVTVCGSARLVDVGAEDVGRSRLVDQRHLGRLARLPPCRHEGGVAGNAKVEPTVLIQPRTSQPAGNCAAMKSTAVTWAHPPPEAPPTSSVVAG